MPEFFAYRRRRLASRIRCPLPSSTLESPGKHYAPGAYNSTTQALVPPATSPLRHSQLAPMRFPLPTFHHLTFNFPLCTFYFPLSTYTFLLLTMYFIYVS